MTVTSIRQRQSREELDDWTWSVPPAHHRPLPHLRPVVYLRGDRIDSADLTRCFGYLDAGLLAGVRTDARGQSAILELRGSGATLGEDNLLGHRSTDADLHFEALTPTRIQWWDPAPALPLAGQVALAVMTVMATRIRQQHENACRHRLQSLAQRVAEQLVGLSEETVLGSDLSALQHLTRFDLARIIGTNRSAVSKICSGFERRGWCRIEGKSIALVDREALASYAARGHSAFDTDLGVRLRRHQGELIAFAEAGSWTEAREADSVA